MCLLIANFEMFPLRLSMLQPSLTTAFDRYQGCKVKVDTFDSFNECLAALIKLF